jgi:hypothetical protein
MSLLLMRLPTKLDCRYILKSWKRITANIIVTVNTLMELKMIFYRWYIIFTDGYTSEIKWVKNF